MKNENTQILEGEIGKEPKIVKIPPKMVKRFGEGKMLISSPFDIKGLNL